MAAPYSADAGFRERLSLEAPQATTEATHLILRLMRSQPATRYCRVQLWEHVVLLGEPLPDDPDTLWKLLHEWELSEEAEESLTLSEGRVRP
jgi:hypothetical protein